MQCPECGRYYKLTDPTTFAIVGQKHPAKPIEFGRLVGTMAVPLFFIFMYNLQWWVMGWWHDTTHWSWFEQSSCPGSWWELNGLGNWLWSAQVVIIAVWSIVAGMIISKVSIQRGPANR